MNTLKTIAKALAQITLLALALALMVLGAFGFVAIGWVLHG